MTTNVTDQVRKNALRYVTGFGLMLAALLVSAPARAHKASDSYLTLTAPLESVHEARFDVTTAWAFDGRWDIALADLDDVLGLDANGDGALTQGELDAREGAIVDYALGRFLVTAGRRTCATRSGPLATVKHSDGVYAVLPLRVRCDREAAGQGLALHYSLLFDVDRLHRGLLRLEDRSSPSQALAAPALDATGSASFPRVLSPSSPNVALPASFTPLQSTALLAPRWTRARALGHFVAEGLGHIASGFDHLLFLLALLLPAVVRRRSPADASATSPWLAVPSLREALADVARIVTAFTVAHSLTLALAASGVVRLPSALVEPAIAASVVLAALNNLVPLFGRDRWVVAFALGLLHGFGFSAALVDLGQEGLGFALALFGFNAGVKLGQLTLVAAILPLAFALRNTSFYRRGALGVGSAAIALVAAIWFVERTLALS